MQNAVTIRHPSPDVDSGARKQCEGCGETFCSKRLQRDEEAGCFFCPTCAAICPWCGEAGGTPIEVWDQDTSVGYDVMEQRCSWCWPERRQAGSETRTEEIKDAA